jgi:hypothetical protein
MLNRRSLACQSLAAGVLVIAGRSGQSPRALAQSASPVAPPASGGSPLLNFLAHSPASIAAIPQSILGIFADPALQLAALGVPVPDDIRTDSPEVASWRRALFAPQLPGLSVNPARPEFRELTAWDLSQIDASFELGEPPEAATLLRGRFDLDAMRQAMEALGYQPVAVDGHEVVSLDEEGGVDLESPLGSLVLGQLNNFTVLPDGTLVYARTLNTVQQVIGTESSPAGALAGDPLIVSVVEAIDEPLASAALVTAAALAQDLAGFAFDPEISPDAIATQFAELQTRDQLPPALYALLGVTPGGPIDLGSATAPAPEEQPVSAARIAAHFGSGDAAALAAPIIRERLESGIFTTTGQPYAERFASWEVTALPDQPIVVIAVEPRDRPIDLFGMLYQRDVGFLAW